HDEPGEGGSQKLPVLGAQRMLQLAIRGLVVLSPRGRLMEARDVGAKLQYLLLRGDHGVRILAPLSNREESAARHSERGARDQHEPRTRKQESPSLHDGNISTNGSPSHVLRCPFSRTKRFSSPAKLPGPTMTGHGKAARPFCR